MSLGSEESMLLTDDYHLDRFLVYCKRHPMVIQIPNRGRWYYVRENDVFEPTKAEWDASKESVRKVKLRANGADPRNDDDIRHIASTWPDQCGAMILMKDGSRAPPRNEVCRWETLEEFEERQNRNRKDGENYFGNHQWTPADGHTAHRAYSRRWYVYMYFDFRRATACFLAVFMLGIHCGLLY